MNQRDKLKKLVIDFCNNQGSRTFTLKQLHSEYGNYLSIDIGGKSPQATVRRLLQELRDVNFFSFLDNSGHYTLRGIDLLQSEKDEIKTIDISRELPIRKEYLVETYVRKTRWAQQAIASLGHYCLINDCKNTFMKEDGKPYIEVHHIIPLCKGGEEGIWNLSVLCAHHHRMAHFSTKSKIMQIEKYLLMEVKCRI